MTERSNNPTSTANREITSTRVFDAPRDLVWRAMTDPAHVVRWWGPRGFTTTIEKMEVRPGGTWKHVMHGPDGTDYPNQCVFTEVVPGERLVFVQGGATPDGSEVQFVATWSFDALSESRTRVTVRMVFPSAADRDRVAKEYGAVEGLTQTLDRLGEELTAGGAVPERDFVISRVFDAPRDMVFRAWTEPKQLARWWGPKMFSAPTCEADVRPDGAYRIVMRSPDGVEYPMRGVYVEVTENERLVYTADISGHPPEWEAEFQKHAGKSQPVGEILNIITFEEQGAGTKLTVRMRFGSAAVRDAMVKMGMNEGWSSSLDRLTELLASR